mgnify:FL=1
MIERFDYSYTWNTAIWRDTKMGRDGLSMYSMILYAPVSATVLIWKELRV